MCELWLASHLPVPAPDPGVGVGGQLAPPSHLLSLACFLGESLLPPYLPSVPLRVLGQGEVRLWLAAEGSGRVAQSCVQEVLGANAEYPPARPFLSFFFPIETHLAKASCS